MIDPMTFSDERLRTLIRRMDRGEITRGEFCQVMAEHQVDFARFHRIGAEVEVESKPDRGPIGNFARANGWPMLIMMGLCAIELTALAIALVALIMAP